MRLQRLMPDGRRLVVPELASGAIERYRPESYLGLVTEPARSLELDALDAAVDRAIGETPAHDPALDARLAPALHGALPLTRREAADIGLFRYLAVIHRPDLIRHRWDNRSWPTMRARFWTPGTRPDSNTVARLWWIAELSRRGDDYELTERLLARQPLANNLFVRDLCAHPPLVRAYLDVLADAPGPLIERSLRALSRRLSVLVLEAMDEDALRAELTRIRVQEEG